jgi:CRP-like cAMP-binding protein
MLAKAAPFIARLEALVSLSTSDKEALLAAASQVRSFPARTDLVREGDKATHVHVLLGGFAYRYKLVDGGKRQIVAYLVPGDLCDSHASFLDIMDDSILSIAESRIALIARDTLRELFEKHPAVLRAFSCATLVNNAILRNWLANIGRRSPEMRIAHLICEMHLRLYAVGLADGNKLHFPITQADLADTMGLSTVHTNRTLQMLKAKKLIVVRRGFFEIVDFKRLQDFCDFDPSYLQIKQSRDLAEG